ncbi:efflux RND transporter periplasmic adaptor subunit [Actibacterium sp. 188UL27-1]|uniref:efflux RND transporter periplasmic adaptor subunit n=1 Tax=Actibacterium sp. 188UL27-1 TaxID=2786961 RepID=UPI00195E0D7A|nr:efflux RND transporter periplasmic adaptor subunit [Actibacterium sp. 188UL27-1]MBM7066749.1 efflux RND transporter periplasmic adaptor subunit [Actibacterium sp. 188UL27-1]
MAQTQIPPDPTFVKTQVLMQGDGVVSRQFFGRIAAVETIDLSFEQPGYLQRLDAPEGVRISEGQLVAQLDVGPFERAVQRAQLALAQAEREYNRATSLAQSNTGSAVRARDAETARDLAQVALRDAEEALDDARIEAPFNGLIADRIASPYTTISPGEPIVRMHDLSEVRVEFDLPERLLKQIGDPTRVDFETVLPGTSDPVDLEFREFRAEASAIGQSYTISLAVPDASDLFLVPGATVTVRASLDMTATGIAAPATAIIMDPDRATAVMVVGEGDNGQLIARRQPVDVVSQGGTTLAVTGLEDGAEIVTVGAHLLKDGQPIKRYTGLIVEED